MNVMSSLVLFTIFILIYTVIVQIFTVLFRLTGITKEKARTQVISLLTNCGFTTSESELILSGKHRRKLARITMLCGYSFSVIIVSVLVNIFLALNLQELKSLVQPTLIMLLIVGALILLMRLSWVRNHFDVLIEKIGNRLMFGKESNVLVLVDIYKEKALVEVLLDNLPQVLSGVPLSKSKLKEAYSTQVLFIKRNGEPLEVINGDTVLQEGDALLLFGDYKQIRHIFEHPDAAK